MNNLKLVTTEKFGEIDCNFYRNMNDDILLTREQIGSALEYANPKVAIAKIHAKHKERLDSLSTVTTLVTEAGMRETFLYTTKGIMEICRWSKQPKANLFIDFCWEVMDKLFRNQPIHQQLDLSPLITVITSMQNDMQYLKYQLNQQSNNHNTNKPIKKYSKWKSKTNPKLKLLADFFGVNQMTILRNIYMKLEDTYDIDLADYQEDYCFETGIDTCSQFDVIEHDKSLREKFDIILTSLLARYEIEEDSNIYTDSRKTIFDN